MESITLSEEHAAKKETITTLHSIASLVCHMFHQMLKRPLNMYWTNILETHRLSSRTPKPSHRATPSHEETLSSYKHPFKKEKKKEQKKKWWQPQVDILLCILIVLPL